MHPLSPRSAFVFVALAALSACAVDPTAPESADSESSALSLGGISLPVLFPPYASYSWRNGEGAKQMMPMNDGVCVLTGVTGNFRGWGEQVKVEQVGNSTNWFLTGQSGQSELGAEAVCAAWSRFGGNPQKSWSGESWASATAGSCPIRACAPNAYSGFPIMTDNHWFCGLNGMSGAFNGSGEIASVDSDGATYTLSAASAAVGYQGVKAFGRCIQPGDHNSVFGSPIRPDETYEWHQGDAPVQMIPVDQGICYLTEVQGNFRGYGESVRIAPVGQTSTSLGVWALYGTSYQTGVGGQARCVYFTQF